MTRKKQPVIDIGDGMTIPIDIVTQAIAIVGKRGRGKSATAKVLTEEMIRAGQQVIVLDTVGAWWGLRSSLDGKSPGLPIVVFGGAHADVPIEDTAGAVIAQTLMRHRVPAVIDLSGFRKAAQRRFATAFIEELYHSNREPLHVVFDEADEFAPQNPMPDSRALLGAMEDFVRRGRLRGLGCTLVSQRPAVIHKDVLTQVEVLVTLGLTGPRDVAAIDEWVRLHATEDQAREVRSSLASLPIGTAWLWSPEWLETLRKIKVRRITTFDSSATPKVGERIVTPTARATIDLKALGQEIAATVEKSRNDDPKLLRARVRELEDSLARASVVAAPIEVPVPTPAITDDDREALADHAVRLQALLDTGATVVDGMTAVLREGQELIARIHTLTAPDAARSAGAARAPEARRPVAATPSPRHAAPVRVAPARTRPAAKTIGTAPDSVQLGKAEKSILVALATHGSLTQRQIGLHTHYAHKSGSFANAMSKLRSKGFIEGGRGESIVITGDGHGALDLNGGYEPLPTGRALVDHWLSSLPKAQRRILHALLEAYPEPLTNEQLGAATGYAHDSGSFANARSRLNVAELIAGGRGTWYAAEELGEAFHQ